jgi:hypothetical protein
VRYGDGVDAENCGDETNPCKNIAYALNKAPAGWVVRLLYSSTNFPSVFYSLPGKLFSVEGVPEVVDGESLYPQIFVDYSQSQVFNFSNACQGSFLGMRLLANSSASVGGRVFLYVAANSSNAYLRFEFDFTDCFFTNVLF